MKRVTSVTVIWFCGVMNIPCFQLVWKLIYRLNGITLILFAVSVPHYLYMYNSRIIIQFLHYDMYQRLFLAIIKECLYSHSLLSLVFPLHWSVFATGGRSCCLLCRVSVIDFNKYCKLYEANALNVACSVYRHG